MFGKHVSKHVLTNDIMIYVIGGNVTLVIMLFNWLHVVEESSNVDNYLFLSEQLRLGKEHGSSEDILLVINTRKCFEYLTGPVDPHEILNNQLIVECKDLWW